MKKTYLIGLFLLIGLVMFSACSENNVKPNAVYNVSITSQNLDYGSVTGGASQVKEGATVTISAVAKFDCYFDEWSDGVRENPRVLVVKEDVNLVAKFQKGSIVEYNGHRAVIENGTVGEYDEDSYIVRANKKESFAYWYLKGKNKPFIWTDEFFISKSMLTEDLHFVASETLCGHGVYITQNMDITNMFQSDNEPFLKSDLDSGGDEWFKKSFELTKGTQLEPIGYNSSSKTYFYRNELIFNDYMDYFIVFKFFTLQDSDEVLAQPILISIVTNREKIKGLKFKDGDVYRGLEVTFFYS